MDTEQNSPDINRAINIMTSAIADILSDVSPSIYLYGSVTTDDHRLGWSDIDILVLTEKEIPQSSAESLLTLRQTLLVAEPCNLYYRSFEGGMLTLTAFIKNIPDRVVYWGTSGERITDSHSFDSFSLSLLLSHGKLLHGKDIRSRFTKPAYDELCRDVKKHFETIRKYARKTSRSIYSFGWLFDIARGIYTLKTGNVISKTEAAEWVLDNGLCPVADTLRFALSVRKAPLLHLNDESTLDRAETLGNDIQFFADVLERELKLEY